MRFLIPMLDDQAGPPARAGKDALAGAVTR